MWGAGDARINGQSVRTDMAAIRQDLGVCPQFDILWPMLTVREHLSFYAHIKLIPRAEHADTILQAAQDVGERIVFQPAILGLQSLP